jgi:hypothetical protein
MADINKNREAWRTAVTRTSECLSIEQLERFVEDIVPMDFKGAAHLRQCPRCQSELAMLKSFESGTPAPGEGAAVAWIAAQLQRNSAKPAAPAFARGQVSFWRSLFRFPYVVAATAVIAAVVFGASLYIFERPETPKLSAGLSGPPVMRSEAVKLIEPSGNLNQPPAVFRWDAYPGAKAYSVELMEVDGNTLWKGTVEENSLTAKPEMKTVMHPGKPLLWKVTALDATGKAVAASSLERFQVGTAQ